MSMGIMGVGSIFAQAARAKKKINLLKFKGDTADPIIYELSCIGEIAVNSIKNGEKVSQSYSDLDGDSVSVQADANTIIEIIGDVTEFSLEDDWLDITELYTSKCSTLTKINLSDCIKIASLDLSKNTALTNLSISRCTAITSLDVSKNTALTSLGTGGCTAITSLDLSKNTALATLAINGCTAITSLDLSKNTALTILVISGCTAITSLDLSKNTALTHLSAVGATQLNNALFNTPVIVNISYDAINENVSTSIAQAITDSTESVGYLYTDSAQAYYNIVADAATAKGWTIAQLS